MSKLQLSVAIGDYDRTRALQDGRAPIDGVDPVFMLLEPEEIFFRAFRQHAFDITEMSFSSYWSSTRAARVRTLPCRFFYRARSATRRSTCAATASAPAPI